MSRLSRDQQRKFALAQTIGKERVKHWAVLPKCTGCPLLIGTRTGDMRMYILHYRLFLANHSSYQPNHKVLLMSYRKWTWSFKSWIAGPVTELGRTEIEMTPNYNSSVAS